MLIIFNFIGAGIAIIAFAIGALVSYLSGAKPGVPFIVMGVIAMGLDLFYRWKVRGGEWFHPRRGGHISFIPVWILGLGICASGLVGTHRTVNWREWVRAFHHNSQPSETEASPSYSGLKVNMISGGGARGFALINGETFDVGEKHRIKIDQKLVTMTCVEIREHSVMAMIEGEAKPFELKMGETAPLAMAR